MSERVWFKIGQTAALVGVTPKELRYWERVIPELKPRRSKGNLRYFHQDELAKLQRIRQWLSEGFTVVDCRELLRGGTPHLAPKREAAPLDLEAILALLRDLHRRLSTPVGGEEEAPVPPPSKPRKPRTPRPAAPPKAEPKPKAPAAPKLFEPEPEPNTAPPPRSPRATKAKPEPAPLGRMWAQIKLPLDWDE